MALSWNTLRHIPRLLDYASASKREADTKPIRGRTPEAKPLGRRDKPEHYIRREENGDITVGMWRGPLLRYRENGDVLIYGPSYWNKASSNEVIAEITGISVETFDGKAWVHTREGSNYLRGHNPRIWLNNTWTDNPAPAPENIFRRVESAPGTGYFLWSYVNPPTNIMHHIRRKEMGRVMKRYAAFASYATAMDSLREGVAPPTEECAKAFGLPERGRYHWYQGDMPKPVRRHDFTRTHAAELCGLMLSADATDNYKAYLWLRAAEEGQVPAHKLITRVVTMHHHAEVLKEVEADKMVKDRYAWAIPKQG